MRAETPYPPDNDADYQNVPNWTSDNEGHYVPLILQNAQQPQPAPTAPSPSARNSYPSDYPADNTRVDTYPEGYQGQQEPPPAYPYDNDSDYEAPRPKGSDGDKNFYPRYYY